MNIYKFISIVLHPIVIPTLGALLYFTLIPNRINELQKLVLLGFIFVITYLIPLCILVIFKYLKLIKSYHVNSIKERKIPLLLMIVLFYLLGNALSKIVFVQDLENLFYASSLGLIFIYILFIFKLKTSLHLFSMGITIGFFLLLSMQQYTMYLFPLLLILVLIAGLLGSSRLHMNAHTSREVYLGFFIGLIGPFIIHFVM